MMKDMQPTATARVRFKPPGDNGRKHGGPPGPRYACTLISAADVPGGYRTTRIESLEGQVSASLEMREADGDGWRAATLALVNPSIVVGQLQEGTTWFVMEGPRVVGELVVTGVLDDDFSDS
jgi:hypothetical protein